MLNAIDFAVSALPALSTERYSTTCEPSAVIWNVDANGLAPPVLVFLHPVALDVAGLHAVLGEVDARGRVGRLAGGHDGRADHAGPRTGAVGRVQAAEERPRAGLRQRLGHRGATREHDAVGDLLEVGAGRIRVLAGAVDPHVVRLTLARREVPPDGVTRREVQRARIPRVAEGVRVDRLRSRAGRGRVERREVDVDRGRVRLARARLRRVERGGRDRGVVIRVDGADRERDRLGRLHVAGGIRGAVVDRVLARSREHRLVGRVVGDPLERRRSRPGCARRTP